MALDVFFGVKALKHQYIRITTMKYARVLILTGATRKCIVVP